MSSSWKIRICASVMTDDATPPHPFWVGNVPQCDDRCPHHDGKRCGILGRRPSSICEPVVETMCGQLEGILATWEMAEKDGRFDPAELAAEKQASRDEDARALASGEKTADQLRRENSAFAFPNARITYPKREK